MEFRRWDHTVDVSACERAMDELIFAFEHIGGELKVLDSGPALNDNEAWFLTFSINSLSRHGWSALAYITHYVQHELPTDLQGKVGMAILAVDRELQYRVVVSCPEAIPELTLWLSKHRRKFSEFVQPLMNVQDLRDKGLLSPDEAAKWADPKVLRRQNKVSPAKQKEWLSVQQLRARGLVPPDEVAGWVSEKSLRDKGLVPPAEAQGFVVAEPDKWPSRAELIRRGLISPSEASRWILRSELAKTHEPPPDLAKAVPV